MDARTLIDNAREGWVSNSALSPTRSITYTRDSDDIPVTINAFIGGGQFNQEEKDKLEDYQVFSGLKLEVKPEVNDTVAYDTEVYKVKRFVKLGTLWQVFGRISNHNGKPRR